VVGQERQHPFAAFARPDLDMAAAFSGRNDFGGVARSNSRRPIRERDHLIGVAVDDQQG
jgi:hypothetical protein